MWTAAKFRQVSLIVSMFLGLFSFDRINCGKILELNLPFFNYIFLYRSQFMVRRVIKI